VKDEQTRDIKGLLGSGEYFKVLTLLKSHGISYKDMAFGFDRYYFNEGLYRLAGNDVFLIYTLGLHVPFRCAYLKCSDCDYRLRLSL